MSGNKGALEAPPSSLTPKWRASSRRAWKRRTMSPKTVSTKPSESVSPSAPEFLAYDLDRTDESNISRIVSNCKGGGLKKVTSDITPTDMFFSHISSSAPSLGMWKSFAILNQTNVPDTCQVQTAAVPNSKVITSRKLGFERENEEQEDGTSVPRATRGMIEIPRESVEHAEDDELCRGGEKWHDDSDSDPISWCKARVKRFTLLPSHSARKNKEPQNKPFSTKKATRPIAIMKDSQLLTGQVSIPSVRSTFKIIKRMSDGFTKEEARPTTHSAKRRKLKELQSGRLEPLELTQKLPFTQKVQGPMWLRGQKKTRLVHGTISESITHFAGGSQRQLEVQDPLDDFDNLFLSLSGEHSVAKRPIDDINSDDSEDHVRLLTVPQDEPSMDSLLSSVLLEQELHTDYHDADEEVDLLRIPGTDMLESASNASSGEFSPTWNGSSMSRRLPPKKLPDNLDCDETGLTLRPNSWVR